MEEREQTAESVGQRIFLKRKELGLSQGKLADLIGVQQVMISRWERGERAVPGNLTKKISEILQIPTVDLIITSYPERTRKPKVSKETFADFLKTIPIVGAASAGHRLEMAPSQTKESLFDVLGRFPDNVMAVRVCGDSMSFMGRQSISDGDFVIVDPNRKEPSELVGKVVCARFEGEEHLVKELFRQGGKYYLRSWNPTYPPIEIDSDEARIEGVVILIFRRP